MNIKKTNSGGVYAHLLLFLKPRYKKFVLVFSLLGTLIFAGVAGAAAISYGYKTTDKISYGALVSTVEDNPSIVKLATKEDARLLLGIAVKSDDSLLSLSNGTTDVEVAVEGATVALVSDINGSIKAGDPITISPMKGVGMKSPNATKIVGVAQQPFDKNTPGAATQKITNKEGKVIEVAIGKIPLNVKVETYNGNAQSTTNAILQAIQNAVSFIAGRQVPIARALVAVGIVMASLLISSIIVYTSVRTSFISVGRNPLAQSFIRKNLYVVLLTVISILGAAFLAAYLVIK